MSYLSDLLGTAYKEGMTEDEISKALESKNDSNESEILKLKNALNKANSEAADWKKKLREKQTDEEAAKLQKDEEYNKILEENTNLKRSISISEKKAKLLTMGYDEKLANETAVAMVDGDMDKVMNNQAIYLEGQKKEINANRMKNTPRLNQNGSEENVEKDYDKLISEAKENNDLLGEAYYTRLKAQAMEEKAGNEE